MNYQTKLAKYLFASFLTFNHKQSIIIVNVPIPYLKEDLKDLRVKFSSQFTDVFYYSKHVETSFKYGPRGINVEKTEEIKVIENELYFFISNHKSNIWNNVIDIVLFNNNIPYIGFIINNNKEFHKEYKDNKDNIELIKKTGIKYLYQISPEFILSKDKIPISDEFDKYTLLMKF